MILYCVSEYDLNSVPQQFPNGTLLHINDTFEQSFVDLINQRGGADWIVSDHFSWAEFDPNVRVHGVLMFAEKQARAWAPTEFIDTVTTTQCANLLVNKKQINRYLALKFAEWFKLEHLAYTWSGLGRSFNMSDSLIEMDLVQRRQEPWLTDQLRSFLLAPIELPEHWIAFKSPNENQNTNAVSVVEYGTNRWTWDNGLGAMVSNSACSLITESVKTQRGAIFTEKTLYSILGLTLPIWVGGYQQAEEWARVGFDTFSDIVDHSYQHHNTLVSRCYHAYADNIKLLTDLDYARTVRDSMLPRLKANRDLLLSGQLEKFNNKEMARWPKFVQDLIVPHLTDLFRKS